MSTRLHTTSTNTRRYHVQLDVTQYNRVRADKTSHICVGTNCLGMTCSVVHSSSIRAFRCGKVVLT